MDNEKKFPDPEDTGWLDELLASPSSGSELQPDEQALSSHDMGAISDMELDRIMQEAMSAEWDLNDISQAPDAAPVSDDEYADDGEFLADDEYYDDEAYYDDEEYYEDEDDETPVRKVRPKKKNGYGLFGIPHFVSTAIWVALALFIGVTLGNIVWICASDVLAFGRQEKMVTVTITANDTLDSIADKLFNSGLIKYKDLFKMYGELTNAEKKIDPGTYELNTLFDYMALVKSMQTRYVARQTLEVTIPEGYTCAQIFALLEENGVCKAADLEKYAQTSDFASYWFLEGVPKGHKYCLEGFLFPDTYEFYKGSTAKEVFIKLLGRFDDQFSDEMLALIDKLNTTLAAKMKKNGYGSGYISEHKLTLYDVVTVASMVEKESAHSGEGYDISSVIYNRFCSPNFPKLQIDATVVYALGGKNKLTPEDLKVDHPYNTYIYEGLPPGPISNPGLTSLLAALGPSDTGYYYYALDPSINEHHFSKTYKEHQNFLNSLK